MASTPNFPISFKPKVAIAKFMGKIQKKSGIMKSGLDAMPLFLLDDLLSSNVKTKLEIFQIFVAEYLNFTDQSNFYMLIRVHVPQK